MSGNTTRLGASILLISSILLALLLYLQDGLLLAAIGLLAVAVLIGVVTLGAGLRQDAQSG